jgi:hypothetical protein
VLSFVLHKYSSQGPFGSLVSFSFAIFGVESKSGITKVLKSLGNKSYTRIAQTILLSQSRIAGFVIIFVPLQFIPQAVN